MLVMTLVSGDFLGRTTDAANTPWFAVVPGSPGVVTRLTALQLDSTAGTANSVYLMRPINGVGTNTSSLLVQVAQVATDTTLVVDRDPSAPGNTVAAGDQIVYVATDGTYRRVTVSAWNPATNTLTVSALPVAVAAGAACWNFGVYTDTDPRTGLPFPALDTDTTAVRDYAFGVGYPGRAGEPLLVYCPNATNATVMTYGEYGRTGS